MYDAACDSLNKAFGEFRVDCWLLTVYEFRLCCFRADERFWRLASGRLFSTLISCVPNDAEAFVLSSTLWTILSVSSEVMVGC
jgi:hypothetical protein